MVLALAGLVLSFAIHFLALGDEFFGKGLPEDFVVLRLGLTPLFGEMPMIFSLHVGLFLVWMPAILLMLTLVGYIKHTSSEWNSSVLVYSGFPSWVKYSIKTLYFYWWVNFAIGVLFLMGHGKQPATWLGGWIIFSAGWMLGYAAALAMLINVYRQRWRWLL